MKPLITLLFLLASANAQVILDTTIITGATPPALPCQGYKCSSTISEWSMNIYLPDTLLVFDVQGDEEVTAGVYSGDTVMGWFCGPPPQWFNFHYPANTYTVRLAPSTTNDTFRLVISIHPFTGSTPYNGLYVTISPGPPCGVMGPRRARLMGFGDAVKDTPFKVYSLFGQYMGRSLEGLRGRYVILTDSTRSVICIKP